MSFQEFTSADTSLNQIPSLHRWYARNYRQLSTGASHVIDLGAGRYDAAGQYIKDETCMEYLPQDPWNRSHTENTKALRSLASDRCDTLCSNVLNVIKEPEARSAVISLAACASGVAYFSVYEGDRSGVGRRTTKGWQNNRRLVDYIPELKLHFDSVTRIKNVLVCVNHSTQEKVA